MSQNLESSLLYSQRRDELIVDTIDERTPGRE